MDFSLKLFMLIFLTFPIIDAYVYHYQPNAYEESLIKQACDNSSNHESCIDRIKTECKRDGRHGPVPVLHAVVQGTIDEAVRAIDEVSRLADMSGDLRERMAVHDCMELIDYSIDELSWAMEEMEKMEIGVGNVHREGNLRTWLSAALSNQDTCLEGFDGTDGRLRQHIEGSMVEVTQLISNILFMYERLRSITPHEPIRSNRTGNSPGGDRNYEIPPWITADDEELLRQHHPRRMQIDAVVAQDGSGRFHSVMEAVNNAPDHSARRYVIFVKAGIYRENVELKKKKTNIMLIGEGMGKTVITGGRSFVQGWTTFRTATFAVSGQGFIGRDITFRNTAGPQNYQAVALRVDSDRSAFFRCSIEGYQDSLYSHSLRQFFRECHISGTVDFIFGNGQAVFQNCKIFTRRPLPFQKITITAQGRKDPSQTTGFSIHNSFIYATYPTYLGRPWKPYSRTVFMQSYLGVGVQPVGWLEWAGNFGLNTLFYGEYMNYGPGSGLNRRIRWAGYHVIRDSALASLFTARRFIDGISWLPVTGVPFTADLIK